MAAKRKIRLLTAAQVACLKPGSRVRDPGQKGLYLLVSSRADGTVARTWLHRFSFQGKSDTLLTIGHHPQTSLEKARNIVRDQREMLSKGIDPRRATPRRWVPTSAPTLSSAASGEAHTIEALASEFLERFVKPRHKRPGYVEGMLNKDVLPEWKGRDARTIKPREVIELLDKVVARGSPVMANHLGSLLGQMFKYGIHRAIVEDSPVKLLVRPGGDEPPRQRALSDEELPAFLKDPIACTRHDRLARVIKILLLTGQRRGELSNAQWKQVDLKAGTWTIPPENSKTDAASVVPLSPWAVAEFEELKKHAGRSTWVLPGSDPSKPLEPRLLTRGVAKCQERFKSQGIKEFTLHDLRRTCRTGLARLKVEPHIAERVLGHAQERIAATYDVHAYLDEKRAALEKWSAHLQTLGGSIQ